MLGFGNEIIARSIDRGIESGKVLLSRRITDPKSKTIRETYDIPLSALRAELEIVNSIPNKSSLTVEHQSFLIGLAS